MGQAGHLQLLPPTQPNASAYVYDALLRRTTFLSVLEDAVDNACSSLFDELTKVEGNVPDKLTSGARTSRQGMTLHEFCQTAMQHALAQGRSTFLSTTSLRPSHSGSIRTFAAPATPPATASCCRPIESYEQDVEESRFDARDSPGLQCIILLFISRQRFNGIKADLLCLNHECVPRQLAQGVGVRCRLSQCLCYCGSYPCISAAPETRHGGFQSAGTRRRAATCEAPPCSAGPRARLPSFR